MAREGTLLFLGAGTSQPFGIPTMKEMVTKFEKYLDDNNYREQVLYSEIKSKLSEGFKDSVDIEAVFSVINGIASKTTSKDMGPFAYYYLNKYSSDPELIESDIEDANKLKKLLESFIKNECEFNANDEDKIKKYRDSYDPLFRLLHGLREVGSKNGKKNHKINWKAYTTNYDTIFERYWKRLAKINDFFKAEESDLKYFNSHETITFQYETLAKLHGSLDWMKLANGDVIKTTPDDYIPEEKKGTVMLFPIQQKDLYKNPWIHLFREFKIGLQELNLWYIIGYAFNDEFIVQTIKEEFTKNKQMVIINPHASDFKENIFDNHENITALPIKFGNKYFPYDFADFSDDTRTLEIEIRAKTIQLTITFSGIVSNQEVLDSSNFTLHPDYKDNRGGNELVFTAPRPDDNSVSFVTSVKYDVKSESDLKISTRIYDKTPASIEIKNQGRLITSTTIQPERYQKSTGYVADLTLTFEDLYKNLQSYS